jgi:hypothetical protein
MREHDERGVWKSKELDDVEENLLSPRVEQGEKLSGGVCLNALLDGERVGIGFLTGVKQIFCLELNESIGSSIWVDLDWLVSSEEK